MGISRREFIKTGATLGTLGGFSNAALAMQPLTGTIDDAVRGSDANPQTDSGRMFADYILEAQRLINSVSNHKPATETAASLYRQAFDTYEKAIELAKDESDISWRDPKKLTYMSWLAVALMWQAKLVNGTAAINIMKEGEAIYVRGLKPIQASGRADSPGYNFLRALQNYDKLEGIYEEMESNGKRFPSASIGLGLGDLGIIASPSMRRKRIYEAFEGAITAGLPPEHENTLLKRWADSIEQNYKKTGEIYTLDKLPPRTRDKLEPYLAGRGFLVRK